MSRLWLQRCRGHLTGEKRERNDSCYKQQLVVETLRLEMRIEDMLDGPSCGDAMRPDSHQRRKRQENYLTCFVF